MTVLPDRCCPAHGTLLVRQVEQKDVGWFLAQDGRVPVFYWSCPEDGCGHREPDQVFSCQKYGQPLHVVGASFHERRKEWFYTLRCDQCREELLFTIRWTEPQPVASWMRTFLEGAVEPGRLPSLRAVRVFLKSVLVVGRGFEPPTSALRMRPRRKRNTLNGNEKRTISYDCIVLQETRIKPHSCA